MFFLRSKFFSSIRTLKGITRSVSNRDRLSLACALPLRFSVINRHQEKKSYFFCIGMTIYTRTDGLEPSTKWLKVTYSTNWVMSSKKSSIFKTLFSLIRVRAVKLLLYCPTLLLTFSSLFFSSRGEERGKKTSSKGADYWVRWIRTTILHHQKVPSCQLLYNPSIC